MEINETCMDKVSFSFSDLCSLIFLCVFISRRARLPLFYNAILFLLLLFYHSHGAGKIKNFVN